MTLRPASPPNSPARDADALARLFGELAVAAGALVMEVFDRAEFGVRRKADSSPVSEADEASETFLLDALARRLPGVPAIAEESAARGEAPAAGAAFLLIDPLDGTREFIERSAEFTINIAFVENGAPRAGAVYAPAMERLWFAGAQAFLADAAPGAPLPEPSRWRSLRTRPRPDGGLTALVSKSHLDAATKAFLSRAGIKDSRTAGSSLKFCLLAEGEADVYPRFGPTMEWDVAAGHAVLAAAGGAVLDPEGRPIRYGKADEGYRNGPFIAWGDPRSATLP